MVIFDSTGSLFKAAFQADSAGVSTIDLFAGSRSMLTLQRQDEQKLTLFGIHYGTTIPLPKVITWYYSDPSGKLQIPLRNKVAERLGTNNWTIIIQMREVGGNSDLDSIYIDFNPFHGISYNDALAPRPKDAPQLTWEHEHYVVLPPNVIVNPTRFAGVNAPGILVESNYQNIDLDARWDNLIAGVATIGAIGGERNNEITVLAAADALRLTAGKLSDQVKLWQLDKPDDCTNLVCVQWTSQTGATRRHFFPIAGFIKGADKQVSLVSAGDGYFVKKNTYNGIKCRLTGLTKYGYWYYMDLLQASDAHAIVQPTFSSFADEIASEQTACLIEDSEMETPQGNGFYDFEFTIKLRHYGTL